MPRHVLCINQNDSIHLTRVRVSLDAKHHTKSEKKALRYTNFYSDYINQKKNEIYINR